MVIKVCFSCADTESSADFRIPAQQIAVPGVPRRSVALRPAFYRYICHAVPSCYSLLRFVTEQQILRAAIISAPAFSSVNPSYQPDHQCPVRRDLPAYKRHGGQFECQITIYPFKVQQIVSGLLSPRLSSWACAMVASAFLHARAVLQRSAHQGLRFPTALHRHIGQFFQRRETFFYQNSAKSSSMSRYLVKVSIAACASPDA